MCTLKLPLLIPFKHRRLPAKGRIHRKYEPHGSSEILANKLLVHLQIVHRYCPLLKPTFKQYLIMFSLLIKAKLQQLSPIFEFRDSLVDAADHIHIKFINFKVKSDDGDRRR